MRTVAKRSNEIGNHLTMTGMNNKQIAKKLFKTFW